jgi:hypothetical protein
MEQNMKMGVRAVLIAICLLSSGALGASGQTSPPVIFFTDIITGSNKGGESGNGVYLTIYGRGFGATRGTSTVTVGGGSPAQYKIWGQNNSKNTILDMIVVQVGPNAATGSVVVTVNGKASNGAPFTVSTGNIYFVDPNGSDSAAGTFTAPWKTALHAKASMKAGDTVYLHTGVYGGQDSFNASFFCDNSCSGTPTAYTNFVGYPGETAQIGDNSIQRGIYHWGSTVWSYSTIAELTLRATDDAFTCGNAAGPAACNFLRIIGNDMRALSTGVGFDVEMTADHIIVNGNESGQNCLGSSGCNFDNRAYSLYFGGYGAQSNIELGWNRLHDNPFGKGLQVYGHQVGDTMTNLTIHDNLIYNNTMPGLTLGGGDPSDSGGDIRMTNIQIYNNIFYNNAYGSREAQGAVQIQNYTSRVGDYHFYNNSFYNDGVNRGGSLPHSVIEVDGVGVGSADFQNNIFYASPTDTQFYDSTTGFTGGHNLYFGIPQSNIPAFDKTSLYADPKFVNVGALNLQILVGSPVVDAGVATAARTDFTGLPRPQGSAFDIGAYEFASGSTASQPPAPPTNLRAVSQ